LFSPSEVSTNVIYISKAFSSSVMSIGYENQNVNSESTMVNSSSKKSTMQLFVHFFVHSDSPMAFSEHLNTIIDLLLYITLNLKIDVNHTKLFLITPKLDHKL